MYTPSGRRGFSMIELLVTIGVIGVVMAILLPALSGGVGTARRTASLANLRTIGQLVQQYADQSADAYPWTRRGVDSCGIPVQFSPIWQMSTHWPLAMGGVIDMAQLRGVMLSPGARRDDDTAVRPCIEPPSYTYSNSFLADPRVWSGEGVADDSLVRAVTLGMVAYPSSKALMWDWELPYVRRELRRAGPDLDERTPMLFADGHGAEHLPSAATEAVDNPFVDGVPLKRLHNTRNGVRGRDY